MRETHLLIFDSAIEYYLSGRFATFCRYRVAGILFHFAVENLLKSQLYTKYTLSELSSRPFSHSLHVAWKEFKKDFPQYLSSHDTFIERLSKWYELRYPDYKQGSEVFSIFKIDREYDYWGNYQGSLEEVDRFFHDTIPLLKVDYIYLTGLFVSSSSKEMYLKENKYPLRI